MTPAQHLAEAKEYEADLRELETTLKNPKVTENARRDLNDRIAAAKRLIAHHKDQAMRADSSTRTMIDQAIAKVDAVVGPDPVGFLKTDLANALRQAKFYESEYKSWLAKSPPVAQAAGEKAARFRAQAEGIKRQIESFRGDSSPLDTACTKMDAISTDYQKGFEDGKAGRDPKRPGGQGPNRDYDEGYREGRANDKWTPASARQQRGGTFGT